MSYNNETFAQTMSELALYETNSKNYKSLFEEIAQNDTKIYLNDTGSNDVIRYSDDPLSTECCCCRVHRRSSFVSSNVVTTTAKSFNIPTLYNTIWISEMKNATDYIEYLNETRRNSFNSLNKDNRSNYYRLMLTDNYSMNNDDDILWKKSSENLNGRTRDFSRTNHNNRFLQVPKITIDEQLRRTPEFEDISKKIDEIHTLDSSVSTLIYKSIEVHADILVSGLTLYVSVLLSRFSILFHYITIDIESLL